MTTPNCNPVCNDIKVEHPTTTILLPLCLRSLYDGQVRFDQRKVWSQAEKRDEPFGLWHVVRDFGCQRNVSKQSWWASRKQKLKRDLKKTSWQLPGYRCNTVLFVASLYLAVLIANKKRGKKDIFKRSLSFLLSWRTFLSWVLSYTEEVQRGQVQGSRPIDFMVGEDGKQKGNGQPPKQVHHCEWN